MFLCLGPGSNRRPLPLQGNALPTELSRRLLLLWTLAEGLHEALECANAVFCACVDRQELVYVRLNVIQSTDGNADNYKPVQNAHSAANSGRTPHFVEEMVVLLRKFHQSVKEVFIVKIHPANCSRKPRKINVVPPAGIEPTSIP